MHTYLLIKRSLIGLVLYIGLLSSVHAAGDMEWKDVSMGIRDAALERIASSPTSPGTVYVSSQHAVYKSSNGGENWQEVFSSRGSGSGINSLALAPSGTQIIFAGTDEGLYRSMDGGLHWNNIYAGIGGAEKSVMSVAVDPLNSETIYIGTQTGLSVTENGGKTWKQEHGLPYGAPVPNVAVDHAHPSTVYAAAHDGIYKRLNSGSGWEKIFFAGHGDTEAPAETEDPDNDSFINQNAAISILIDPADSRLVYAGTSEGLFFSMNGGRQWSRTDSTGLISETLRDLIVSPAEPDYVYAATDRGVFRYSKRMGRWESVFRGLPSPDIRALALVTATGDYDPSLWAATKRGVFKTVRAEHSERDPRKAADAEKMNHIFAHEPSIAEIRDAAIRYAEVQPEKINGWRKAAEKKAWLPSVRLAFSEGEDWQSSSYYYNYSGVKVYRDDDITKGKDDEWSVSLTWDLSDLVWNSEQTSIDNRSKLMVQLRDDILNEVTRLYFERRRLQYQGALSPSGSMLEQIEYDLRLQELTAHIDALTGSYLSKRLSPKAVDDAAHFMN